MKLVTTAGLGGQMPLSLRVIPTTNMVVIDEPIPVVIEMTNSSSYGLALTWQSATTANTTGLLIEMSNLVGRTQPKVIGSFVSVCYAPTIEPHKALSDKVDLAEVFSIQEPGHYRALVRYQVFAMFTTDDENGKMTQQSRRLNDLQSEPIDVFVELPDPETVGKIELLLQSGRDADVERGLCLLADTRIGVYRRLIPSLWKVIQKGAAPVKKSAIKLFLQRIEIGFDRVPEGELLSELTLASGGSVGADPSVRFAVAESLPRILISGGETLFSSFVSKRVPGWFDAETSPECRVALARVLPMNGERAAVIVRRDEDPQVRVAIIRRLIDVNPNDFLDAAELFSELNGSVRIDGRSVPLAVFVADEKKKYLRGADKSQP
jgi:hypothetical protein